MFLLKKSDSKVFKEEYKNKLKEFIEVNDKFKNNLINEDIYEWDELKVENFKKLLSSYESVESSEFNFLNHQWKIRIYFYGKFKNDNDYFKFVLINTSKKNIYIPTKFVPYFKLSNSNEVIKFSASLLYNFSNNGCYEYKIYNNEFKSFIDNISDNSSNLCVGIYMRTYNNIIIENYIQNNLVINEIQDNNYKKGNNIYFEWAIKDWKNIKKLNYIESPLFIRNNDKWAVIIKKGKIYLKCYSFSLDEDYYHVKSIIGVRYSDYFSKGVLSDESEFCNKENEITFNKELKNIRNQSKIESIEKIEAPDTIIICVCIMEYLDIEENHINKLKNILLEDDSQNKNNIKKINRNYFEYKIENFSDFINEINERYSEKFEVGNYKWKLCTKTFFNDCDEYNNIGIILENKDNFDNIEEFVTCKYLFYIKSSNKYYSFKPSSLNIFNNTKKKSEYLIINKELYNKTIKSFISNDNSLTIGIYIFIYDNFIIKNFINEIKEKGKDNNYEIINNGYTEWEIEDWDKLQKENVTTISSPLFQVEKIYWNVTFYPKEEKFSQMLYFTNINNKNNNIYLRCIFVIRNCNDFSCYEIQKSKIAPLEYNLELKNDTIEDNIVLPIKSLKSYEISKRHLIENNKVIFGLYIFKMIKKNAQI